MRIILFFCFFIFHLTAIAQSYSPEQLLNPKNKNNFAETVSKVSSGEPVVKIGGGRIKPQGPKLSVTSAKELQEKDIPLNLIYNIKTPFGIKETAGNTDHTTDFYTKIQIIDNQNLLIHENIQFITTKPTKIERILPLSLKNQKNMIPFEISVLSFEVNGKSINYDIQQSKESFQIQSTKEFPVGVHFINFKYILKNGIQNINSMSQLFISITGSKWPLPINRFRAIVLYPNIPVNYQKDLLFGSNNISVNEGIHISTDIKGNTIYSNTRPLPAFLDVRVFETFNGKNLPLSFNQTFFEKYFKFLLCFGSIFFLTLYIIVSNSYLKKAAKRGENILKKINDLKPCVLMFLTYKDFTFNILSNFKSIEKTCKKSLLRTKILRACFKTKCLSIPLNFVLKCVALLFILYKYILTGLILFIIIMHPLFLEGYQKNMTLINITLFIYLIEVIIFYKKTIKPIYQKDIADFKEKILNPYLCYGLNTKTILSFYKRYYKTVYILDLHQKLKQVIEQQTKNISLPSLNSKGK